MSASWRKVFRKDRQMVDNKPVTVEGKVIDNDRVSLEISFGKEFWERLETFLKQKQLKTREGIALLLEYGATEVDTARHLTTEEKFAISGRYSSLRFKLFECFQENRAIAVGLSVHLDENRRLKRKLTELKGEEAVPQNDWDSWDSKTVVEYQNRYLFMK